MKLRFNQLMLWVLLGFSFSTQAEDYYWDIPGSGLQRHPNPASACKTEEGFRDYSPSVRLEWTYDHNIIHSRGDGYVSADCYFKVCVTGQRCQVMKYGRPSLAVRSGDGCSLPKTYDPETHSCKEPETPPKENGPGECKNPSVGEPIRIATGNMYHTDTDIAGELPLIRTYNSSLGYWRFNYETKLDIVDDQITLNLGDGKGYSYTKNNGNWESDPDVFHQLTAVDEAEAKWLVKFSSNRQVWFDENGRVIKQQWLDGKAYQYIYEASTATISDTKGNELTLKFNSDNQLIEANANSSYKVTYQYDAQKRLSSVVYPGKKERRFHYENEQFPKYLTGVTDRRGIRSLVWEYDDQGRATVSEIANGKERYSLEYGNNQTTVTNPLGKKTTYYFKNYHGVNNVVKVEGHASANCAAANKNYEYFDNGQLKSKTDWQGVKTTYQYNDRGLTTEKTEAAGTPQARTTETQWHVSFSLPLKVIEPGKTTTYEYNGKGQLTSQSQESTK